MIMVGEAVLNTRQAEPVPAWMSADRFDKIVDSERSNIFSRLRSLLAFNK